MPYRGAKLSNQTHRSRVDSDARIARKSNFSETYLGYSVSYLMDNRSRIILGADQNRPSRRADAETALALTRKTRWVYKLEPKTVGADKGYATGQFVHELLEEKVLPHVPVMDTRGQHEQGIYPLERFGYDAEQNRFICPQGKTLRYWGVHRHSKQHVYRASPKDCGQCPVKRQCTRASYRSLSYHIYEASLQVARKLSKTPGYRISQMMRKRVEELFGEAKEYMGLRRMKFRRAVYVREQVLLTAMAQNMKRMVRLLSRRGPKVEASAMTATYKGILEGLYRFLQWISSPWQAQSLFAVHGVQFFNGLTRFDP